MCVPSYGWISTRKALPEGCRHRRSAASLTILVTIPLHTGYHSNIGGSINRGTPKWMVYKGKSQPKMDDLGVPLFQAATIWHYLWPCQLIRVKAKPPKKHSTAQPLSCREQHRGPKISQITFHRQAWRVSFPAPFHTPAAPRARMATYLASINGRYP